MVQAGVARWVIDGLLDRVIALTQPQPNNRPQNPATKLRRAPKNPDEIISDALRDAELSRNAAGDQRLHRLPPVQTRKLADYRALAVPNEEERQTVALWRQENQYQMSMSKLRLHS